MVSSIEKAIDPYKHHITIVTFDCSKSLRNESNKFMSFFRGKNVTFELLEIKKEFLHQDCDMKSYLLSFVKNTRDPYIT